MKDKDFFLKTTFVLHSIEEYMSYLLKNGWIIKTSFRGDNVSVKIWESKEDKEAGDFMVKVKGNRLNPTLIKGLLEIQAHYRRVLNG